MSAAAAHDCLVSAGISIRIAARLIDTLILGAVGVTLGQRIGYSYDWLLITAALVLAYFVLADHLAGGTVGKLALGLRVIGPDGNRPTIKQSLGREAFTLAGAVPFAGPVLALVAWIWIFVSVRSNPLRQGKHDLLAGGTRVVLRRAGQPETGEEIRQ